jgi:hypothetical protein
MLKTKKQKVKEVERKLDGKPMNDKELDLEITKVITLGVVALLCTLMICITVYNCVVALHPTDKVQIIKKIVDSF